MKKFELKATEDTPYVNIDTDSGLIEIKGKSFPEDPVGFYETILAWLDDNFKRKFQKIVVKIKLDYYNTSTSRCLLNLFYLLVKKKKDNACDVVINWFFLKNDEDMIEAGIAYKGISHLPFNLIEM